MATAVFDKYMCSQGGCHDSAGSAAGFMMTGANWPNNLLNMSPVGGAGTVLKSVCTPSDGPYLKGGTNPAMGLLINKIKGTGDICTGGARMPFGGIPSYLSDSEIACVTSWATTLTSP